MSGKIIAKRSIILQKKNKKMSSPYAQKFKLKGHRSGISMSVAPQKTPTFPLCEPDNQFIRNCRQYEATRTIAAISF